MTYPSSGTPLSEGGVSKHFYRIEDGQTQGPILPINQGRLVGIVCPAAIDGATVEVLVGLDNATLHSVQDNNLVFTFDANTRAIPVDPVYTLAWDNIRLELASAATADRDFYLVFKGL